MVANEDPGSGTSNKLTVYAVTKDAVLGTPVFSAPTPVTVAIYAYPPSAPLLAPGAPFKAEVLSGDKVVASALFSIDPALDEDSSLANRVVPLAAP